MSKNWKYRLLVTEGEYVADTLWLLLHEIFKHRFQHLWYEGKWKD
jgi:hypothetical protein